MVYRHYRVFRIDGLFRRRRPKQFQGNGRIKINRAANYCSQNSFSAYNSLGKSEHDAKRFKHRLSTPTKPCRQNNTRSTLRATVSIDHLDHA